ncbi:MAG TPA: phosphoglucosamine mutase, partial [Terriglobales bacterium]|nr:phosphoglucosamine mutase [Terriglobales bacterium]
ISGPMLESALAAGFCAQGVDVRLAGIIPTPAVALLTHQGGAAAGAVISASHNPFADNGIKFFGADGFKLADLEEQRIEEALQADATDDSPTGAGIGSIETAAAAADRYVSALKGTVSDGIDLRGLRIVVDCANGAAYRVAPQLFDELGTNAVVLGAEPNGTNINDGCGALHPASLQARVIAAGASVGIAVDGDADRLVLVDEKGELADGDDVLGMIAVDRAHRNRGDRAVVGTVMSNLGLELALRSLGIELIRAAVGDRYVVEQMQRRDIKIGGESSGHLIFLEHSTTGDGLLASLQVLELMVRSGKPLSELRRSITKCPQALVNVRVAERRDLATVPRVQEAIRSVEAALDDRGRVLVRYSGTEPLVRVMVEGENEAEVQRYAREIGEAVKEGVGE